MPSILNVGQSALAAAQVGLTTTGHNIANANTPGYSRQIVVQGTASAQDSGFGFLGKGTQVIGVKRVYDEYLSNRMLSAQTSQNELGAYYAQIKQVNNVFADASSGLSPVLQDFFKSVQHLAGESVSGPARQTLLSSAETLASQFRGLDGQLSEMRQGVNTQIKTSVDNINSYAAQLAKLNDAIAKAQAGTDGKPANDLLDQRDHVVSELSKEIKVSIVKQSDSYSVFIGNGQPLVVGNKPFNLVATASPTDPSRAAVGYVTNGTTVTLAESMLTGGRLGGLFEFRSKTLDLAQNSLGRVAIGLAATFNAQHKLGQDQNGNLGADFFKAGSPDITTSSNNAASSTGKVNASISNVNALTTSDYQVQYDGTNVNVTRLSDGTVSSATLASMANGPLTVDGVEFRMTGTPVAGDMFLVKPTAKGAADFNVAIKDKAQIAAAAPIRTANGSLVDGVIVNNNAGSGAISAGVVNATTLIPSAVVLTKSGNDLTGFPDELAVTVTDGTTTTVYPPGSSRIIPFTSSDTIIFGGVDVSGATLDAAPDGDHDIGPPTATLTYDDAAVPPTLSGFPTHLDVKVTSNGTTTTFSAGTPVTYTDGATISYGGISFTLSGVPANGDQFTVGPNSNGVGDNRNMLLLGTLQAAKTLDNGNSSYQGAYGQLVNSVGNKTHELEVTSTAEAKLLAQAVAEQQSNSGVNLDEEATNLLRYQQAYQAAGKVMQTAGKLFDLLLDLGR